MSKLFIISEEEKDRILNLHESATNRQYLPEQQVKKGLSGDPYEYMEKDGKYYFRNLKKGETKWTSANKNQSDVIKSKIFKDKKTRNITNKGSKFTKPELNVGITKDSFRNQYYDTIVPREAKLALKTMEQIEKEIGNISEKTYKQLNKIKKEGQLKNDSFIIVNKDAAIASLFTKGYKFIGKSFITSGRQKDVKPVNVDEKTYKNWFIRSLDFAKKNPSHKDSVKINKWIQDIKKKTNIVKNDGSINYDDYNRYYLNNKGSEFPYSYESSKQQKLDVTPGGVYSVGSGATEKSFVGSDSLNVFPLVDIKTGEKLTPAIHGYAGKQRGDLIKQFSKQDVNVSKDLSRAGAGCVNVDENFVKLINRYNPKYVVILPDSGQLVDVKIVGMDTWSEKIASLGEKCVKSFISLFS
jgi:hypothetical protein